MFYPPRYFCFSNNLILLSVRFFFFFSSGNEICSWKCFCNLLFPFSRLIFLKSQEWFISLSIDCNPFFFLSLLIAFFFASLWMFYIFKKATHMVLEHEHTPKVIYVISWNYPTTLLLKHFWLLFFSFSFWARISNCGAFIDPLIDLWPLAWFLLGMTSLRNNTILILLGVCLPPSSDTILSLLFRSDPSILAFMFAL